LWGWILAKILEKRSIYMTNAIVQNENSIKMFEKPRKVVHLHFGPTVLGNNAILRRMRMLALSGDLFCIGERESTGAYIIEAPSESSPENKLIYPIPKKFVQLEDIHPQ
jgi:hypothetical protein